MIKLLPIVEGQGEVEAVPLLLRNIVEQMERWDVVIERPMNSHGKPNLTREEGIERFLQLGRRKGISGILVLLDADKDCARSLAEELAARSRSLKLEIPIAIVCANRCYEAWFLASMETIAGKALKGTPGLPPDCRYDEPPEERINPKTWITEQLSNQLYKETVHQAPLSTLIDIRLASERSRSFRRLVHGLEQLLDAIETGTSAVTP